MKLAICIKGCEAHRDRYEAQQSTWAATNQIVIAYLTGKLLGVPDDYEHLPAKTKAICKFADSWDYCFLCDTDTYVHIPRLLASGFEQWDYSGHVLSSLPVPPYCSGPHYWLSKKALNILADADWSRYSAAGYETCEDVMVGTILAAHGIAPHHDPRYALFESPTPENDVIANHLSCRGDLRIKSMYEAHKKAYGH